MVTAKTVAGVADELSDLPEELPLAKRLGELECVLHSLDSDRPDSGRARQRAPVSQHQHTI